MIARRIEEKVFRDIAPQVIRHVAAVPHDKADGLLRHVYDQMARDFQVVPPITLHSPEPAILAGVWGIVRESMVAGPVSRVEREAVAAAISKINDCPFCVDVHTTMLHGGAEHSLSSHFLSGKLDSVPARQRRRTVEWALATRKPNAPIVQSPPFPSQNAPTIIGTAVAFHYINRMVNIFLEESPIVVPSFLKWLKRPISRLAGSIVGRRIMGLTVKSGESLRFLPDSQLPQDFSWAADDPNVAGAFARFASVMEDAGQRAVPVRVRELVERHVNGWNGDDPGISRGWVEKAVADLEADEQAAGRITLLAALASYQVDDQLIAEYRYHFQTDGQFISTAAWASYQATRRVASWIGGSANQVSGGLGGVDACDDAVRA